MRDACITARPAANLLAVVQLQPGVARQTQFPTIGSESVCPALRVPPPQAYAQPTRRARAHAMLRFQGGTPCSAQTWCRRAPQIAPLVCAVVSPGRASKHLPVSHEMQHIQNTPGPKRRPSVQVAHPTIPSCPETAQTGGASIRRWPPMRLRKDRTCISHKSCAHHYVVSNGPLATPCKTRPCQHLPRRRWAGRLGTGQPSLEFSEESWRQAQPD